MAAHVNRAWREEAPIIISTSSIHRISTSSTTASKMGTNSSRATSEEVALRKDMSGGVLLSHSLSVAVPSALKGLTSGFGMGPGISPSLWPP
jgi:hypothetical protein